MDSYILMDKADFDKQLSEETKWIEESIKEFLPKGTTYQKTINDAMEYSLMAAFCPLP